jgi:dTDP-glucose pyrophosphorylase
MHQMDLDQPMVILNGDQIIRADLEVLLSGFGANEVDGGIVVFEAIHPRWSFVRCDEDGWVVEAAEKRPISNLATAGVYYFATARDVLLAAKEMIKKDARVDEFYYICPTYNELVLLQRRIAIAKIPKSAYWSLATPTGVNAYEQFLLAQSESGHRHEAP